MHGHVQYGCIWDNHPFFWVMYIFQCKTLGYFDFVLQELNQNKLSLLPQQIEGQRQTMADLFQETFNASNDTWPALAATNPSGYAYSSYFWHYCA